MKKITTAVTVVLLAGCIGLLQFHSIQFWRANVDATTGWAWSLLLEAAALWLWSSSDWRRRSLGALATLLLLAGPMYHVSAPLVEEWQTAATAPAATSERHALLTEEIASLAASLATYEQNSVKRSGWERSITDVRTALAAKRAELNALVQASAAPQRMSWQRAAIIAMQAIGIALLQFVGVLCIGDLRRAHTTPRLRVVKSEPKRETASHPYSAVARRLLRGVAA